MNIYRRLLGLSLLLSTACLTHAAEAIYPAGGRVLEIETLDRSADPGKDIFQFSNGTWLKNNPVPADRSLWSEYVELGEKTLVQLRGLVESAAQNTNAPVGSPMRMVGDYYRSGMNETAVESAGTTPLAAQFAAIAALKSRQEIPDLIARLQSQGLDPLFEFTVDQDAKNSTRYIVQLYQGGLGLPDRDYYLNKDKQTRQIRDAYLAHVSKMFELLGDPKAQAERNAKTVMRIETALARASMTKVDLRDPQKIYHLMDLAHLSKTTPNLNWESYFSRIDLKQPGDLNVAQPDFFKAADKLVKTAPLEDLKTYLRWHVIDSTAPYLNSAFVNENFDFKGRVLAGAKELQARWKRVLGTVDGNIGEALGQLYVAKYFPPEAKAKVLDMVANLKAAMREDLQSLEWMSPATRVKAVEKLDKMNVKIGYPDRWRDYSTLAITADSYLENTLQASNFEFRRNLAKIGKPIDRNEWQMTPPTVNAYYNPSMNEMVFPAGVLQPPLYDVNADDASNYGNTGATIGHEMTHGFDDEGRQFDAEGNLNSWWSPADEKNFIARSRMIEKQFDAFVPIDDLHINGKLTAGENIADLGGLKMAYRALETALAKNRPGLIDGFTPEQRFFIAYAQSFRENIRPEQLRLQLATNPHAPGKYRVLGPVANLPEFTEAFHLPPERSPLQKNAERVEIW